MIDIIKIFVSPEWNGLGVTLSSELVLSVYFIAKSVSMLQFHLSSYACNHKIFTMNKLEATKITQGLLSLWQLFLIGSAFSVGVFVPAVESAARPAHALDDVWELGMGGMHFLTGPAMMAATVLLTADGRVVPFPALLRTKTARARLLALLALLAFLALAASARGVAASSRATVFTGVVLQALPLGIGKRFQIFANTPNVAVLPLWATLISFEISAPMQSSVPVFDVISDR